MLPPEIASRGDINSSIQIVVSLMQDSQFVGRSYLGKPIPLDSKQQMKQIDYVTFSTKSLKGLRAVIEYFLVTEEVIMAPALEKDLGKS